MKSADTAKLKFMFDGLAARYIKNEEYFTGVTFSFFSGAKKHEGAYTRDGVLRFAGTDEKTDFAGFSAWIVKSAAPYDAVQIRYGERGACTVIDADGRGVRSVRQKLEDDIQNGHAAEEPAASVIKTGAADDMLRAIGVMTADGKMKNDMLRKYRQIDRFVSLIADMFDAVDSPVVNLLDCACGKSYLSFALNYYLREVLHRKCRITGIDISDKVISESRAIAKKLGYENMEFVNADLRTYTPAQKPDMMISLHACDVATDYALAAAVRCSCKCIVCVPCCHSELLTKFIIPGLEPLLGQGILRARFNDALTDSLRVLKLEACGYKVSVNEYISPLETPKNLLIRAVRHQNSNPAAHAEYSRVCAQLGVTPMLARELDGN